MRSWLALAVLLFVALRAGEAAAASDDPTAMTIHVTVVVASDRITPEPFRGARRRFDTDAVVRPNKEIQETTRVSGGMAGITGYNEYRSSSEQSATLGAENPNAVWHVLGPNKLQRLAQLPHAEALSVWTIETDANHGCRVEAKIVLPRGTTVTTGTLLLGTPATFTNFRVLQASCTIE